MTAASNTVSRMLLQTLLHARARTSDVLVIRLWLETSILSDEQKPEVFRMSRTTKSWWDAARANGGKA